MGGNAIVEGGSLHEPIAPQISEEFEEVKREMDEGIQKNLELLHLEMNNHHQVSETNDEFGFEER